MGQKNKKKPLKNKKTNKQKTKKYLQSLTAFQRGKLDGEDIVFGEREILASW